MNDLNFDNLKEEILKRGIDYTQNTYIEPEKAKGFLEGISWTLKKLNKLDLLNIENGNTINTPCKTGDHIWFIDDDGKLQWADVVAFTETQIVVDTARTKGSYREFKEKLPISEWGKTILKTDSREEAEKRFNELGFKNI